MREAPEHVKYHGGYDPANPPDYSDDNCPPDEVGDESEVDAIQNKQDQQHIERHYNDTIANDM